MFRCAYSGRRRPVFKIRAGRRLSIGQEWLVSLLLGLLLAAAITSALGAHLRPIVGQLACTEAENIVKEMVEEAAGQALKAYQPESAGFVRIQRDENGAITALSTDVAALNELRSMIVSALLEDMEKLESSRIKVPLGSVLNADFFWGRGPALQLEVMSMGSVEAGYESEFDSAGVNQTIHRLWLDISVPLTLMLPGERMKQQVDTRISIGETVIVGQVPGALIQTSAR